MRYMLITVIDRELSTKICYTFDEAYKKMVDEVNYYADDEDDEYEINKKSAWANVDNGETNCDWWIVEI